ncbi:DNA primase [Gayadomonas joobiniege]|uniref:DNA primase n=1 Tax=Gayadomonas joobiniege TaxID=1234606 RepID=UPI0003622818|nr:DNA primase [Gayadomonas joobiniege]
MAGRIPRAFIDDLVARTDIVEVIDSRVKLKKTGKNYSACCPFHNEKSPSFTVAPDKQFYYCFGCGAKGNALSFLMEYDGLEFVDAVEDLAARLGLDVPREQGAVDEQVVQQSQQDYQLMAQVADFYTRLMQTPEGRKLAVPYAEKRGLSEQTLTTFKIGYALDSWDALVKKFGRGKAQIEQLKALGLVIEKEGRGSFYDRFRGRLIFPIQDRRGKFIGFGGRVLGDGTPKYLNSPETRIFSKGRELYGLYQAKQANRGLERLLVVEGYMDVVALYQAGIQYAVASLGTATTSEQISLMLRSTSEIVCCYDGDNAGRQAAWRTLQNALPSLVDGVRIKFMFLPDGEDPDSYVQTFGRQAFEQQIEQAEDFVSFFYQNLYQQIGENDGEYARSKLSQLAQPLIDSMPDSEYKHAVSSTLAVKLKRQLDTKKPDTLSQAKEKQAKVNATGQNKVTPVRMLVALLLSRPHLAEHMRHLTPAQLTALKAMEEPGMGFLVELVQVCLQKPTINAASILEHWRGTANEKIVARLLTWEHHVDEQNIETVFLDALEKILSLFIQKRKALLQAKARMKLISEQEKQEYLQLLKMR